VFRKDLLFICTLISSLSEKQIHGHVHTAMDIITILEKTVSAGTHISMYMVIFSLRAHRK